MTKLDIVTFGCRLNAYESEVMRREASAAGLDALEGGAVIVNTCAVTAEAVAQSRQSIRRLKKEAPTRRIQAVWQAGELVAGPVTSVDHAPVAVD